MSASLQSAAAPAKSPEKDVRKPSSESTVLAAGGLAALLAGACCLGPLFFVGIGVSGAWLGYLPRLQPYRPLFLGVAVLALALAWRRIYRPAAECQPGEVCAVPQVRRGYKIASGSAAALAETKTVTLAVPGMEAVVTYDDSKATLGALTTATANAGYPSSVK